MCVAAPGWQQSPTKLRTHPEEGWVLGGGGCCCCFSEHEIQLSAAASPPQAGPTQKIKRLTAEKPHYKGITGIRGQPEKCISSMKIHCKATIKQPQQAIFKNSVSSEVSCWHFMTCSFISSAALHTSKKWSTPELILVKFDSLFCHHQWTWKY